MPLPPLPIPPPPPHASTPPVSPTSSAIIPSMVCQLRRLAGMPMRRMQPRAAPPSVYQGNPRCTGMANDALLAAVVETVRVAVPELAPVILTGAVEPKLKVGRYSAPVGLDVSAAVSVTLPVKPPLGVTVIAEVLPVVAPGSTVTDVPARVKLGTIGAVTVSFKVFDMLAENPAVPW